MELSKALHIAASGMQAQTTRIRTIAENLANANSTSTTENGEPYRRKTVSFKNEFDRALGVEKVKVSKIERDQSPFEEKYDPAHPSANKDGYVKMPNVKSLVEMVDMRQAQRSYEANLNVVETSRQLLSRTLDLLRG